MKIKTFKDSLLFRVVSEPIKSWRGNDIYHFVLRTPYHIIVLTLGVLIALIVDLFLSNGGE
jgi:hypothetical protein